MHHTHSEDQADIGANGLALEPLGIGAIGSHVCLVLTRTGYWDIVLAWGWHGLSMSQSRKSCRMRSGVRLWWELK